MLSISIGLNIALLAAIAILGRLAHKYRTRAQDYRSRLRTLLREEEVWPVPVIPLEQFDPAFQQAERGSAVASEVVLLGEGDGVPGGMSDRESWVLGALAKRARRIFEFGTGTGKTTYLLARNAPPNARVTTLTLTPDHWGAYRRAEGDAPVSESHAREESAFTQFVYQGTPVEGRIEQLIGDSKALDETRFSHGCNLVLVDGSHAYSYVKSDSEKALRMVAPGGIVLWHDYRGRFSETPDVFRFLNRLVAAHRLVRFAGTSLVAYRAPGGAEPAHEP